MTALLETAYAEVAKLSPPPAGRFRPLDAG